jgi:8-oxo-dGTP diphosphatase
MTSTHGQMAKVGVGVMILKNGKVLLGRRKGSHGAGELGGIGGHLEYGETLEQAIMREIEEECGITVKNVRLLCITDLLTYMPKHYIDVGFVADWAGGEPEIREPHKLESWGWYEMDGVPNDLFACGNVYIEAYKTGKIHFTLPKERRKSP